MKRMRALRQMTFQECRTSSLLQETGSKSLYVSLGTRLSRDDPWRHERVISGQAEALGKLAYPARFVRRDVSLCSKSHPWATPGSSRRHSGSGRGTAARCCSESMGLGGIRRAGWRRRTDTDATGLPRCSTLPEQVAVVTETMMPLSAPQLLHMFWAYHPS